MSTAHVEVVAELPPSPLLVVAGESIARVATLQAHATALEVKTADDAQAASALLIEVQQLSKLIEGRRVEAKAPFLDMGKRIDAAVKPHTEALNRVASVIRPKLAQWQAEQERLASEAERKRQAEIARLEEERKKKEREAAEAQKRAATASPDDFADVDADLAAQRAANAQVAVANLATARQIVQPAKPAGVSFRTTLGFTVTNVNALPSSLVIVTPNEAKIRADFCHGWKEGDPLPVVPGVTFTVNKTTVVTGGRR